MVSWLGVYDGDGSVNLIRHVDRFAEEEKAMAEGRWPILMSLTFLSWRMSMTESEPSWLL